MSGPMAPNSTTARGAPASPSLSDTLPMPSKASQRKRARPAQVQTNLPSQSPLTPIPPSAISNSSVASSSQHDSPLMTPEQAVMTTNNSSIQASPEGLRGRDMEQCQPSPFQLPESVISRRTSSNSLGQSIMSGPTPSLHEVLGPNNKQGGGLIRRLSNRLAAKGRRQSSAHANSRDGSVGPGILRRRSDSINTAPPECGGNALFTDSDDDFVDERDDIASVDGLDGQPGDLSPLSATASTAASTSPPASTIGPVVPLSLLKGTWISKASKKNNRKRICLVLEPDSAKISWDRNRPSKCIYIDDIKEIRTAEDIRQYRFDFGIPESEECRFFSILYAVPDKSKSKMMHLVADDEESFLNWTTTLDAISKHRQELMTSLMAFNDKAIRVYWHGEMSKQFGDRPYSVGDELIDLPGVERICRKLHIHVSSRTLQDRFREAKSLKSEPKGPCRPGAKDPARLNFAEFQEFVRLMKIREDIRTIYREIATETENGITCKEFLDFLREVQGEAVDEDAEAWTAVFSRLSRKGKPRDAQRSEGGEEDMLRMTEAALASFLTSTYNPAVVKEPRDYDLDHPMNEYFISSSHNTYLLGRQVKGVSSVEGYISALLRGCRCVEIDCWDGADGQPIVVHGRTMTTPISFREVINTINKYAFVKSRFPLWISLEVHCNPAQQEVMVNVMKEVFKEKLVTEPLASAVDRLPTPSELKDRILIKAKKPQQFDEVRNGEPVGRKRGNSQPSPYLRPILGGDAAVVATQTVPSSPSLSPSGPIFSPRGNKVSTIPRVDTITEGEVHDAMSTSPSEGESDSEKEPSRKSPSKITKVLGALGVYSLGIKFNGFDSADAKAFNHILSFKEKTFTKNSQPQEKKRALYRHNMRYMMRVYPNQTRFNSSNFDPLIYWKRGVQMSALNWQTFDLGMQLNQAMFDGGTDQSGYVLKPPEFREIQVRPNLPLEWIGKRERKNVNFSIDVISAQQLMRPNNLGEKRTVDPYIEVEVFVPDDKRSKAQPAAGPPPVPNTPLKFRTNIVKDNGFNPSFEKKFNFSVTTKYPDLVFVRWSVKLSDGVNYNDRSPPLATFTAKLSSLKQGYRTLPLLDHNGDRYLFSTLFCRIKVEPATSVLVPYPEDSADNANKLKTLGGRVFNRSSNQSPKSSFDSGLS